VFKYVLLAYLIFSGIILAQSYYKATANIKVKLISGAAISVVNDNLDSNQFSKLVLSEADKEGSQGILLHFTGINTGDVIINYKYLNNYKIISNENNSFEFLNDSSFTVQKKNTADIYFWIDKLSIHTNSSDEIFQGIYSVSLVYN
jgi:hypothetical protein